MARPRKLYTLNDIAAATRKPLYSVRYHVQSRGWQIPKKWSRWEFEREDYQEIVSELKRAA